MCVSVAFFHQFTCVCVCVCVCVWYIYLISIIAEFLLLLYCIYCFACAVFVSGHITVTEWYSTTRPMHCDHFRSVVSPHLSSIIPDLSARDLWQLPTDICSSEAEET
jgi:hypothetical protein